ncbi:MAG: CYTH domain-containing protein [SAR324 cluster bacterium]|nr:CYTH domain-containing protein [SAR324 cluster bacterium]
MQTEIERKFLVKNDSWRKSATGVDFRQGYLPTGDSCVVRIRSMGPEAVLTIKGRTSGISRQEFEYAIPCADADRLLDSLCELPLIEKTRYRVQYQGFCWEIDVFRGENRGLIIAEIELEEENQKFPLPAWIGREVSDDPRFFNVNLVKNPYKNWAESFPNID